jgi:hypothetical protein
MDRNIFVEILHLTSTITRASADLRAEIGDPTQNKDDIKKACDRLSEIAKEL